MYDDSAMLKDEPKVDLDRGPDSKKASDVHSPNEEEPLADWAPSH